MGRRRRTAPIKPRANTQTNKKEGRLDIKKTKDTSVRGVDKPRRGKKKNSPQHSLGVIGGKGVSQYGVKQKNHRQRGAEGTCLSYYRGGISLSQQIGGALKKNLMVRGGKGWVGKLHKILKEKKRGKGGTVRLCFAGSETE